MLYNDLVSKLKLYMIMDVPLHTGQSNGSL